MCEVEPENTATVLNESVETFESWDAMELRGDLLRGIYSIGFEKPSPIQTKAIMPVVKGRDVIGQAQSGTG